MTHIDLLTQTSSTTQSRRSFRLYTRFGKRTFDLALAIVLLPILAPLIAVLCLVVRGDGTTGMFSHPRVGRHGHIFQCWKIRTMVPGATERLATHLAANPDAAAEWARTQKLTDDPRVTPLGHFLRRTSLDELPQIWNVLRGEMSFVGPRPVTPTELGRYGALAPTYLSLTPGVTGHWQVYGRGNGCYAERLRMDQTYAMQVSFWRDTVLILATALVVFWPTGR